MYTLKNNKLPRLHLWLNGYEIKSKNDRVIDYVKTIIITNRFLYYYIHIFYHLQDSLSNICVSLKRYDTNIGEWIYDFYSGKYEEESMPIIRKYDKRLLKYIEHIKES